MRKLLLLTIILLGLALTGKAQESAADKESETVRQVVETYLYSEEPEERKRTLYAQAKIFSLDPSGTKVVETPISRPAKNPPGKVKITSRQRIVSIDVTDGGASVKVETDLSTISKHIHYLSLLKVNNEWKIVSILMPPLRAQTLIPR